MKLAACSKLVLTPEHRVWFRAINPKHAPTPIGSAHTIGVRSRFSPGPNSTNPFEILYFSENQLLTLFEVEAMLGSIHKGNFLSDPNQSDWLTIRIDVVLQQVADLCDVGSQRLLGTNAQELTGDWDGYHLRSRGGSVRAPVGISPTQDLGEALFSTSGLEGFRSISAKIPTQINLVVFPQKLLPGSQIIHTDHAGKKTVLP